jgi:hypothetical protein
MYTFVDELKTILEGNLKTYLDAEASRTYKLPMPEVYDYEKVTFEKDPSLMILPETMTVESKERGGEVLLGQIMLWFVLKGTKRRYPRRLYLYDKAIRKTIWDNKNQSNREYWINDTTYLMERTLDSQLIHDMMVTVMARGEYNYV